MTAMAPHVYIDDLGVCVECLLEVDLLTHGQYKRLALVSYSVSNGIWLPCRIGIAGQQSDGYWCAVEPSKVRTWMHEHRQYLAKYRFKNAGQMPDAVLVEFRAYERLLDAYKELNC